MKVMAKMMMVVMVMMMMVISLSPVDASSDYDPPAGCIVKKGFKISVSDTNTTVPFAKNVTNIKFLRNANRTMELTNDDVGGSYKWHNAVISLNMTGIAIGSTVHAFNKKNEDECPKDNICMINGLSYHPCEEGNNPFFKLEKNNKKQTIPRSTTQIETLQIFPKGRTVLKLKCYEEDGVYLWIANGTVQLRKANPEGGECSDIGDDIFTVKLNFTVDKEAKISVEGGDSMDLECNTIDVELLEPVDNVYVYVEQCINSCYIPSISSDSSNIEKPLKDKLYLLIGVGVVSVVVLVVTVIIVYCCCRYKSDGPGIRILQEPEVSAVTTPASNDTGSVDIANDTYVPLEELQATALQAKGGSGPNQPYDDQGGVTKVNDLYVPLEDIQGWSPGPQHPHTTNRFGDGSQGPYGEQGWGSNQDMGNNTTSYNNEGTVDQINDIYVPYHDIEQTHHQY